MRAFDTVWVLLLFLDPKLRGYLADPQRVREAQVELAQKYGYPLIDLSKDPKSETFRMRKDPLQCFHGLEPGWVVNLADRTILKPIDEDVKEYYSS